jgi:hypothetical protein
VELLAYGLGEPLGFISLPRNTWPNTGMWCATCFTCSWDLRSGPRGGLASPLQFGLPACLGLPAKSIRLALRKNDLRDPTLRPSLPPTCGRTWATRTFNSTKGGWPQNVGAFGFGATATCSLDQPLAMTAYTPAKTARQYLSKHVNCADKSVSIPTGLVSAINPGLAAVEHTRRGHLNSGAP